MTMLNATIIGLAVVLLVGSMLTNARLRERVRWAEHEAKRLGGTLPGEPARGAIRDDVR